MNYGEFEKALYRLEVGARAYQRYQDKDMKVSLVTSLSSVACAVDHLPWNIDKDILSFFCECERIIEDSLYNELFRRNER